MKFHSSLTLSLTVEGVDAAVDAKKNTRRRIRRRVGKKVPKNKRSVFSCAQSAKMGCSVQIFAGRRRGNRRDRPTSLLHDVDTLMLIFILHHITQLVGASTDWSVDVMTDGLLQAKPEEKRAFPQKVDFWTAAAPPPASVLRAMEEAGFNVIHVYGLTEVYGPAVICEPQEAWAGLDPESRAVKTSRQGVRYAALEGLEVMEPETMTPTPADGETLGEVMMRGNVVMKGYLKNDAANAAAFEGGWFHTGDLGVKHADGYVQLKDRSKDIIISGGENISSIEVEEALYRHPAVGMAAVVARPDEKWGETPCAFVELKDGASLSEDEAIAWCREQLAHFKAPRNVVFGPLPKTSTGKIQKFKLRERAAKI